jgi:predicted small secreted protein
MYTIKKIILCSLFLTTLSMITACGTIKGFGKDVSHAGHGIQKAASN